MRYPYNLCLPGLRIEPLFRLQGPPCLIDLSGSSVFLAGLDPHDRAAVQRKIEGVMRGGYAWGLSPYLERRETILDICPQMAAEERYFHLGLDIIVPLHAELRTPLDAVVEEAGYEEGDGNYGGYVLLRHEAEGAEPFFSLYGHLERASLPAAGAPLSAGSTFARIGDHHENGGWFHHTHLQIITEEGLRAGFLHKGYCSSRDMTVIDRYCPDPVPLFRVR